MATLGSLVVKLTADTGGFVKDMNSAEKGISGFLNRVGRNVQSVGRVALGGLGVVAAGATAIGVALSKTIAPASEFQDQLVDLNIAAKASGLSMEELRAASLAVGGDTRLLGVSASGAAESITGLFKAGLSATEIFGDLNAFMDEGAQLGGTLRAAIDLAAATTLDMVEAADLGAVVLATFGAELETEAERAAFVNSALNNMVQAADASVAEVEDLAMALKNVGPTASNLGIGIEDVNNSLAILSTRGINGAEAGTALKSVLANLQRPTEAVQGTLKSLGVSLFDSEGKFIGLRQLVSNLGGAMAGMTDEQKNLTAQTLAGTFGMNALNTLLAEGVTGWDAMSTATSAAAGIQEQAAAKAQTLSGVNEALEGQLETLAIEIGSSLIPAGMSLAQTLLAVAEVVGPLVVDLVAGLGPGLESVTFFLDSFVAALLAGQTPLEALKGALADVGLDGVARGAGLVSIQVFSRFNGPANCGFGNSPCAGSYVSDQIAALEHVLLLKETHETIAAVNMSLGGALFTEPCDSSEAARKAAIDNLRSVGVATWMTSSTMLPS